MFLRHFVLYPLTSMQNFTETVSGNPSAKCNDVGHVEGYILETVQDMASGTIID